MDISSILTKQVIDSWLHLARQNMQQDGFLTPVCLLRLTTGQGIVTNLTDVVSAQTHEQKRMQLILFGKQIRDRGQTIAEAVMIMETWYVSANADHALTVAPSQHPDRQEAIVIIGRNAANTHATCVTQLFTRDEKQKPVWGSIPQALYNEPVATGMRPIGLVDYLFVISPTT